MSSGRLTSAHRKKIRDASQDGWDATVAFLKAADNYATYVAKQVKLGNWSPSEPGSVELTFLETAVRMRKARLKGPPRKAKKGKG
jgi:hypothetical protein